MKTPRTDRGMSAMVRLYCLALWLYPTSFRTEFADEMQVIFSLRLKDAMGRGISAFLATTCKEALTLPSGALAAHAQARKSPSFLSLFMELYNFLSERGSKMSIRHLFPKTAERTPWYIAILSLVPFILPGPLAPLITYHPWWDPNELPWIEAARFPVTAALIFLGFLIGILRHFPRWSYLYPLYVLFVLPGGIIYLVKNRFFEISPEMEGNLLLLLVFLILIATPFLRFLRPFFSKIRHDWTLLSFALYACTFFLLSTNDMDESPVYNLQVLLPSLITWLGALAYLLLKDPFHKIGALLAAQLLGVSIWWLPVIIGNTGTLSGLLAVTGILLLYWMILAGLTIAPILINVSTRTRSEPIR